MSGNGRSVIERLVATAAGILFAVVALTVALDMLRAIWPTLAIVVSLLVLFGVAIALYRSRSRGW